MIGVPSLVRRFLPTLVMLLATSVAAGTSSSSPVRQAQYPVYFLGETEALLLLQEALPDGSIVNPNHFQWLKLPQEGRSKSSPKGYLLVSASEATQSAVEATLKVYDVPSPTLTFRVYLLVSSKSGGVPAELPPAERKALQDFASVMPFKAFELLHSARFNAEEQGYSRFGSDFEMLFRFEAPREATRPVLFRSFRLGRLTAGASDAVLETSFSMRRGETFVLGASQVSDGGLVVLVTIEK